MASGLYSQHLDRPLAYKTRNAIIGLILFICAIIVLFPLVYMLAWSFGPNVETAASSYHIFPRTWTLDSYKAFFNFSDYSVKWLFNSFVQVILHIDNLIDFFKHRIVGYIGFFVLVVKLIVGVSQLALKLCVSALK